MRAEIVTTGTELLLGQIDDTNATYLARQLHDLGIDLYFRSTVGDNEARIAQVLEQALARADVIITTGGLGPTVDDVTREAVARVTGRSLVLFPDLLAQIEAFFARLGPTAMTDNNRRQAYLPEGCIPVENPVGTAPAFIVEDPRGTIITLPGVPREMRYLTEHAVVPYLLSRLGQRDALVTRVLRTVALGESRIDQLIADLETSSNPTVGLSAHLGQTDVRIVAKAKTIEEAEALVADFEAKIRERLGAIIYATGDTTVEAVIADLLQDRGARLAVAETMTGGQVSQRMSFYPEVFAGSLVAPDSDGLQALLGLREIPSQGEGAAVSMAEAVRKAWQVSHGLAVVGEGEEAPWAAIATPEGTVTRQFLSRGRGHRGRVWMSTQALELLRRLLLQVTEEWVG